MKKKTKQIFFRASITSKRQNVFAQQKVCIINASHCTHHSRPHNYVKSTPHTQPYELQQFSQNVIYYKYYIQFASYISCVMYIYKHIQQLIYTFGHIREKRIKWSWTLGRTVYVYTYIIMYWMFGFMNSCTLWVLLSIITAWSKDGRRVCWQRRTCRVGFFLTAWFLHSWLLSAYTDFPLPNAVGGLCKKNHTRARCNLHQTLNLENRFFFFHIRMQ